MSQSKLSPLADPRWRYVEKDELDKFSAADWALLDRQRRPYLKAQLAAQALSMLQAQQDTPTFGYMINNFEHCLLSATLALRDGCDEETVVCSLFHDLGFVLCNETHGDFAAALLAPYVSERNVWMLRRHMYFQEAHCETHPDIDSNRRERWRGHPWFEYTVNWVAKYDQNAIHADQERLPLSAFEAMVHKVLDREPRPPALPGWED